MPARATPPLDVLFVATRLPPAIDGIGDFVARLAVEISRSSSDHSIGAMALAGGVNSLPGVSVFTLSADAGPSGLVKLLRVVRELRPRLLAWQYAPFAYGRAGLAPEWALLPWLATRLSGAKVLVTAHELFFEPGRRGWKGLLWTLVQRAEMWLIRLTAQATVAPTQGRRRNLGRWLPKRERALWRIPVGANIERVDLGQTERRQVRQELGVPAGTLLLGTFSRLNHQPSMVTLIRSLPLIMQHHSVQVLCLSVRDQDEPNWRAAMAEAHRLGVADRVLVRGAMPANGVSRHLQALDLYVALYQEGSPKHWLGASCGRTTLVTAMAHALPMVTTTGHEFDADLFQHGQNCWLLPPCPSAEAIAGAVTTLLADEQLRERIAIGALETYEQRLSWPRLAAEYRGIFAQVLAS